MATVLRRSPALVLSAAATVAIALVMPTPASAQSEVSGWFTGYAMGNRYGAFGVEVTDGMFANHTPQDCPGDPAAYWAVGSSITLVSPSPIVEHDAWGATTYYESLTVEDSGDPSCSQGNYWADVYFGRFKLATEPCDCPGSPSPGYCIDDQAGYTGNACNDATNFGRAWATYWSPP